MKLKSTLLLAGCLLAPCAQASTVTLDQRGESTTGGSGYLLTLDDTVTAIGGGWSQVAEWGFFNDEVWADDGLTDAWSVTGTVDGLSFTVSMFDTLNVRRGRHRPVDDHWSIAIDLPSNYRLDFGLATGGTGSVAEWAWDYAVLMRLDAPPPIPLPPTPHVPTPVPLPAAGLLLVGALALLRRARA